MSNWLVRFLDAATVGLATSALALFWGCLALGRLASARWSDRFDHARFAAAAALISAVALVAASIVPSLPASIVLFGVVGFAFGPVYPLIMAVAGDLFPTRSAAVSGFLSGSAVIGGAHLPAADGLRVGRRGTPGGHDRRRRPGPGVRVRAVRGRPAVTEARWRSDQGGGATTIVDCEAMRSTTDLFVV